MGRPPFPVVPCSTTNKPIASSRMISGSSAIAKRSQTLSLWLSHHFRPFLCTALLVDLFLAGVTLHFVPYTEIDWKAYMQEVSGVLQDGEMDYSNLRGDTGPLVYPAGFVYLYSLLFYSTDRGESIGRAQLVFAVLHAATLGCAMYIYWLYYCDRKTDGRPPFPLWSIVLLLCSRRVMSLFVLRLFNDGIQSLFMYLSIILFATNRWSSGCLVYSASVSVKMNALLYAPAVAVLLCQALGPMSAFLYIVGLCGGFQLLVGFPFLVHAPVAYISKAFEFSRVFEFKWSVNGAFMSEANFLDRRLSLFLLTCHLLTLVAFGHFHWTNFAEGGLRTLFDGLMPPFELRGRARPLLHKKQDHPRLLRPSHVIRTMFACNLVGIVFARTLHYQFYLWYFHTLPILAFISNTPTVLSLLVLATIELVFNVYPPQASAAAALAVCHIILLGGLWQLPACSNADIFSQKAAKES